MDSCSLHSCNLDWSPLQALRAACGRLFQRKSLDLDVFHHLFIHTTRLTDTLKENISWTLRQMSRRCLTHVIFVGPWSFLQWFYHLLGKWRRPITDQFFCTQQLQGNRSSFQLLHITCLIVCFDASPHGYSRIQSPFITKLAVMLEALLLTQLTSKLESLWETQARFIGDQVAKLRFLSLLFQFPWQQLWRHAKLPWFPVFSAL